MQEKKTHNFFVCFEQNQSRPTYLPFNKTENLVGRDEQQASCILDFTKVCGVGSHGVPGQAKETIQMKTWMDSTKLADKLRA